MTEQIKNLIRFSLVYDLVISIKSKWDLWKWEKNNRPNPPPNAIKQATVKDYARRFSIKVLIETGTFYGSMLYACRKAFTAIYSIELDGELYQLARKKLARFNHIAILHGNSVDKLPEILATVSAPCVFWLDGHCNDSDSASRAGAEVTPILQELRCIFAHNTADHVILIDDARLFVGANGYPTVQDVQEFINSSCPECGLEVRDDIIRIHQPTGGS